MSTKRVPLGVLDLVPVSSGATAGDAVANAIDLAQHAEMYGYHRYWFAEHHLNPGVAGSSPAVMIALVAGSTRAIRLGSGGVQSGHRTALSAVEEFGLVDALHPGRLDLGMGRSGGRNFARDRLAGISRPEPSAAESTGSTGTRAVSAAGEATDGGRAGGTLMASRPTNGSARPSDSYTANGLLIPERPSLGGLTRSARLGLTAEMLQQPEAKTPDYGEFVGDVLSLLDGTYRSRDGIDPRPVPGQGASVEVWVLGSSAGTSASVAGRLGLPFAANYHVSPATVLEAVGAYRQEFVPSARLDRPHVMVSADVVVAEDDAKAKELATGYGLWVRSIRRGEGAIAFPTPEEANRHRWSEEDRALVADRVDTQFVGSPATAVAGLERLREATDADELLITTITHDHADRVRSYELLAEAWAE